MKQTDPFKRLLRIAPPPSQPVHSGTPDSWAEVERRLGWVLPGDYKRLINIYGSGDFGDFLVLLNPCSPRENRNLLNQVEPYLDIYRSGQKLFPEDCPFLTYPTQGGLLPVASDLNGGDMFWLTEGTPDEWTLVHYNWRGGFIYQQHAMGLVAFLVGWLSGELPECFFGVGNSPNVKRNPVFSPPGYVRPSHGPGGSSKAGD